MTAAFGSPQGARARRRRSCSSVRARSVASSVAGFGAPGALRSSRGCLRSAGRPFGARGERGVGLPQRFSSSDASRSGRMCLHRLHRSCGLRLPDTRCGTFASCRAGFGRCRGGVRPESEPSIAPTQRPGEADAELFAPASRAFCRASARQRSGLRTDGRSRRSGRRSATQPLRRPRSHPVFRTGAARAPYLVAQVRYRVRTAHLARFGAPGLRLLREPVGGGRIVRTEALKDLLRGTGYRSRSPVTGHCGDTLEWR